MLRGAASSGLALTAGQKNRGQLPGSSSARVGAEASKLGPFPHRPLLPHQGRKVACHFFREDKSVPEGQQPGPKPKGRRGRPPARPEHSHTTDPRPPHESAYPDDFPGQTMEDILTAASRFPTSETEGSPSSASYTTVDENAEPGWGTAEGWEEVEEQAWAEEQAASAARASFEEMQSQGARETRAPSDAASQPPRGLHDIDAMLAAAAETAHLPSVTGERSGAAPGGMFFGGGGGVPMDHGELPLDNLTPPQPASAAEAAVGTHGHAHGHTHDQEPAEEHHRREHTHPGRPQTHDAQRRLAERLYQEEFEKERGNVDDDWSAPPGSRARDAIERGTGSNIGAGAGEPVNAGMGGGMGWRMDRGVGSRLAERADRGMWEGEPMGTGAEGVASGAGLEGSRTPVSTGSTLSAASTTGGVPSGGSGGAGEGMKDRGHGGLTEEQQQYNEKVAREGGVVGDDWGPSPMIPVPLSGSTSAGTGGPGGAGEGMKDRGHGLTEQQQQYNKKVAREGGVVGDDWGPPPGSRAHDAIERGTGSNIGAGAGEPVNAGMGGGMGWRMDRGVGSRLAERADRGMWEGEPMGTGAEGVASGAGLEGSRTPVSTGSTLSAATSGSGGAGRRMKDGGHGSEDEWYVEEEGPMDMRGGLDAGGQVEGGGETLEKQVADEVAFSFCRCAHAMELREEEVAKDVIEAMRKSGEMAQMEDAAATKSSGGGSAGSWAGGKQDRGAASSSSFAQALRDEGRSGYGSETEVEAEGMLQELGEMMGSCEELSPLLEHMRETFAGSGAAAQLGSRAAAICEGGVLSSQHSVSGAEGAQAAAGHPREPDDSGFGPGAGAGTQGAAQGGLVGPGMGARSMRVSPDADGGSFYSSSLDKEMMRELLGLHLAMSTGPMSGAAAGAGSSSSSGQAGRASSAGRQQREAIASVFEQQFAEEQRAKGAQGGEGSAAGQQQQGQGQGQHYGCSAEHSTGSTTRGGAGGAGSVLGLGSMQEGREGAGREGMGVPFPGAGGSFGDEDLVMMAMAGRGLMTKAAAPGSGEGGSGGEPAEQQQQQRMGGKEGEAGQRAGGGAGSAGLVPLEDSEAMMLGAEEVQEGMGGGGGGRGQPAPEGASLLSHDHASPAEFQAAAVEEEAHKGGSERQG